MAQAHHRADCAAFRNDLRFSVRHHQHFDDPTNMKKKVDANSSTFYRCQSKGIVNVVLLKYVEFCVNCIKIMGIQVGLSAN